MKDYSHMDRGIWKCTGRNIEKSEQTHRPYYDYKCIICGFPKTSRPDNITRNSCKCNNCGAGEIRTILNIEEGLEYNNCKIIKANFKQAKHRGRLSLLKDLTYNKYFIRGEVDLKTGMGWHADFRSNNKTNKSKLSEAARKILDDNNIARFEEYSFMSCYLKNDRNRRLYFDDFLPEFHCLIEYQGIQHYDEDKAGLFKDRKQRMDEADEIKIKWCNENGWNLIHIPYYAINELKLEDFIPAMSKYLVSNLVFIA